MNFEKLNLLGTETLISIKDFIDQILAARLDTRLMPGREASFDHGGTHYVVRIDKINSKTCNCTEISPVAGHKVRVGISMLKVNPTERKAVAPVKAPAVIVPHKPVSAGGDAW
jgi:hypothetical protein